VSWKSMRLGDVLRLKRGHDLPKNSRTSGDIPIVSSSGITGWHNVAKVAGPGVVTGRYGTLGEVHYIEGDYWPLNTALYVEDFKGNHPRFSAYLLMTLELGSQNAAGAVPGVNRNTLHQMPVRVPDVETQRQVAQVLFAYDDLIATNQRRIALLEEAGRRLYREWFVHLRYPGHEAVKVVDGVPDGWKRKLMDDVCESVGGGTPATSRPEFWDGDVVWVTPTDVTRNNCLALLDSGRKITEAGLNGSSAKLLPANAILMTSRASIGYFALMDVPACTNQGFISVLPKFDNSRMYLLQNLMARVDEMEGLATGATFKELSKRSFRALSVLWPTESVLEEFEAKTWPCVEQVRNLKKQTMALAKARDALLPKLMSGQLDVSGIPLPQP
jgi:type I restriction enzyme S subunit